MNKELGVNEHRCPAVTAHRGPSFVCQKAGHGVDQNSYCKKCTCPESQSANEQREAGAIDWKKQHEVLANILGIETASPPSPVAELVDLLGRVQSMIWGMEQNYGNLWVIDETPESLDALEVQICAALAKYGEAK